MFGSGRVLLTTESRRHVLRGCGLYEDVRPLASLQPSDPAVTMLNAYFYQVRQQLPVPLCAATLRGEGQQLVFNAPIPELLEAARDKIRAKVGA